MKLDKSKVIELALLAGFDPDDDTGLSGETKDDAMLYVAEHPVGIVVLKLAELIEAELTGETQ